MKTACLILAAGKSTRMRSERVKVLHPVCGRAMIDYPVDLALKRGYDPVVVVVGHQADAVENHLAARADPRLRFVLQEPQLGTGHAVMVAREALKGVRGKLAILYGDMPLLTGRDLGALERAGRDAAVAFLTCRLSDPRRYGRVVRGGDGRVERIVEFKDASRAQRGIDEINTGIYLVDCPWVFKMLDSVDQDNAQGEYYLTDLVHLARQADKRVVGRQVDPESVIGVNDRIELARLERAMRLRLVEALMAKGVTVQDPQTTFIGPDVRVGTDSVILAGCHLAGRVVIGKGCQIGPGVVADDVRIADGAQVRAYSVLEDCRVGPRAQIGPFARLRPGTEVGADAKVGNFVEAKKTKLGKGAKASHLTYLGDADVGPDVNVGAGTITCNYDGVNKHPTRIGAGAFIGSDTQLVAPVTVGKEAYVGAGTTVTRDVPDGALAVSRTRQRNYEGYAEHKKKGRSKGKSK